MKKNGGEKFNSFECQAGVNPLLFSQLCLYHYVEVSRDHDYRAQSIYHQADKDTKSTPSKLANLVKKVSLSFHRKVIIGQVILGTKQQPIYIPSNSTITILGHTNELLPRITCLVEQVEHHNLPLGIVINWCVAIPKTMTLPVIIINSNRYNVWVRQPLLAAKLYDSECNKIEYRATMDQKGDNVSIGFQPVPPQLIYTNSCQVESRPI